MPPPMAKPPGKWLTLVTYDLVPAGCGLTQAGRYLLCADAFGDKDSQPAHHADDRPRFRHRQDHPGWTAGPTVPGETGFICKNFWRGFESWRAGSVNDPHAILTFGKIPL